MASDFTSIRRRDLLMGSAALLGAGGLTGLGGPAQARATEGPIVKTTEGRVRGLTAGGVHSFKGMRYGAPTADRRFMPALPPEKWEGVRDAFEFGDQAPQLFAGKSTTGASWRNPQPESEDCLRVNVFTPGVNDGKKRAVMFWIHGGLFANGSGAANYSDGTRLAKRHDVVVVTVNHRLNAFGYLYLAHLDPELADSGNIGDLDLIQALRWVRDNIAGFGGDPGNVMIFGQSGGGMKVTALMAMPDAEGLFHRAGVQSGSLLTVPDLDQAKASTADVLAALDLKPTEIDKLRTMPFDKLVAALPKSKAGYWPVVDGRSLKRQPFDPDAPPASKKVPLLVGYTRTELTLLRAARDPSLFELTWETLPAQLAQDLPAVDPAKTVAALKAALPGASPSYLWFVGVSEYYLGRVAQVQAARKTAGGAPAYLYLLDWRTPVEGGKWMSPHSLDLAFVFDNVPLSESMVGPETAQTTALAQAMSGAWTRFAKTGSPGWAPYTAKHRTTMVFDTVSRPVDDPTRAVREIFAGFDDAPDVAVGPITQRMAGPSKDEARAILSGARAPNSD